MMAEELKRCPECGGKPVMCEPNYADEGGTMVVCDDCDFASESFDLGLHGEGRDKAAIAWNTRPSTPPAVSDDLVEEIARALSEASNCPRECNQAVAGAWWWDTRHDHPANEFAHECRADDMRQARAILPIIQRREQQASEAMREKCAVYVEGAEGVIPGAAVFAGLISGNNQPCMSGDMRDRINPHTRRRFDDATQTLATAIRSLAPES